MCSALGTVAGIVGAGGNIGAVLAGLLLGEPETWPNTKQTLARKGCNPMDFTGRPMRGFVFVNPEGTKSSQDLKSWLRLALESIGVCVCKAV